MTKEFIAQFFQDKTDKITAASGSIGISEAPNGLGDNNEREKKDLDHYLDRGEIPTGYKIVEDMKDVPSWLTNTHNEFPELPFLISEDPLRDVKVVTLPKDFRREAHGTTSSEKDAVLNDANGAPSNGSADSGFYGSSGARRKRARETKSRSHKSEQTHPWFFGKDINLIEPTTAHEPAVIPVRQVSDGSYVPVSAASDQLETVQGEKSPGTPDAQEVPPEHAHGGKGSQPEPGTEGQSPAPIPTQKIPGHIPIGGEEYFIDHLQFQELVETFYGRLHSQPTELNPSYLGLNIDHLTINHGAKDAEVLLNTLVTDLCQGCGATKMDFDILDITELIAGGGLGIPMATRASRLSFKIYKDMYGPQTGPQDSQLPFPLEEEEDGMNEEEDSGPLGIPLGIPARLSDSTARGFFRNLTRSLNKGSGPYIEFIGSPEGGSDASSPGPRMLRSLTDNVLSSILQVRGSNDFHPLGIKSRLPPGMPAEARPLVIHIPNYRAVQENALTNNFLAELGLSADKHNLEKRTPRVMVVGTDCVREEQTHKAVQNDPNFILTEQNNKSWGSSTNVLLTPVFPTKTSEKVLLEDRQNRIRTINARHLRLVLKARGIELKGLGENFHKTAWKKNIAEEEWNTLGSYYWSYLEVQRLATLIAGERLQSPPAPITKAFETMVLSDQSKLRWATSIQPPAQMLESKEPEKPINKQLAKVRSKATRHEKRLLSGVIEPDKIPTTFKDIHIPVETIEALQNLTTLSLVRPEAFRYGVLKSDRIPGLLLYGPPGTGKTLAAKAVAKESGATMLEVSGADLKDMYVGEGEKNVQALFSLAKKLSPCVVFLDEADAIFSARSSQGRHVNHRELLNQFLREWDGMSNDSGSAFIMVATNRPMDLDDAVLRRLPRRLLVDLPTEKDRLEILRIHLRHEKLDPDVQLPEIAKKTAFYSGSDLKNVAVAAALNAVREENEAAKQYRLDNPDAEKAYQYPEKRVLTMKHFDKALEEISASISEDMSSLKEIKKFDEQYGDRKGRKKKAPKWGFKSASEADRVLETIKVRS